MRRNPSPLSMLSDRHAAGTSLLEPMARINVPRLPASLVEPLFTPEGWMGAPSPLIAGALAAAAPNTRQAWAADWAVFRDWCLGPATRLVAERCARVTLPVAPELVAAFILDQRSGQGTVDGRPRAINTVRRYLSTLATLHRLLELPDPVSHPLVRHTLKARPTALGADRRHPAAVA